MNLEHHWPRALGLPLATGNIKSSNSDFQVVERLPEMPSGTGEHLWLRVSKEGQNTDWVARQIARWAQTERRNVSYAGLKDRHAKTEQTFSLQLPGKQDPDLSLFNTEGVNVLSAVRHSRKLKTGHLIGNYFKIRIRNVDLPVDQVAANWAVITQHGVPNYFGPQRFGFEGKNVQQGMNWLLGREKIPRALQSILLSSVRSYLFNHLLSQRVKDGTWNQLIPFDFAQFTEGKAGFYCEQPTQNDLDRCAQGQLSPCASLVGLSKDRFDQLDEREHSVLNQYREVVDSLCVKKVSRHFRKLRVLPEDTDFSVIDGDPVFSFFLPAGSFATTVLSETLTSRHSRNSLADWIE